MLFCLQIIIIFAYHCAVFEMIITEMFARGQAGQAARCNWVAARDNVKPRHTAGSWYLQPPAPLPPLWPRHALCLLPSNSTHSVEFAFLSIIINRHSFKINAKLLNDWVCPVPKTCRLKKKYVFWINQILKVKSITPRVFFIILFNERSYDRNLLRRWLVF